MTEGKTILDHIEQITVDRNPFADPANEYYALLSLRTGLEYLHGFAVHCDQLCLSQLDSKRSVYFFGNYPEVKGIPHQLLSCVFYWYALSACQYVKIVGTIAYRQDSGRPTADAYLNSVIPEVRVFRDKVAAHFAWLTKNEHDSEAERLMSIIPQVTWWKDSFHVGAFKVRLSGGGKSSSSEKITAWSIAKVHKRLQHRYWPPVEGEATAGTNTA